MIGYILDALVLLSFQASHPTSPRKTLIYFGSFPAITLPPPPPAPGFFSQNTFCTLLRSHSTLINSARCLFNIRGSAKDENPGTRRRGALQNSEAGTAKKGRTCLKVPGGHLEVQKHHLALLKGSLLRVMSDGDGKKKDGGFVHSLDISTWMVSPIPSQIPSNSLMVLINMADHLLLPSLPLPSPTPSFLTCG